MMLRVLAVAALAAVGFGAALVVTGGTAATASCEPSVTEGLLANRIVGPSKSYRADNPAEYALVRAYLDGGSRPSTTGMTHMGLHLVYLEDTCRAPDVTTTVTTTDSTTTTTTTTPPPTGCAVDPATMTAAGCSVLRSDTSVQLDPRPGLWGTIDCGATWPDQDPSRHVLRSSGGDPRPKSDGTAQGNTSYRELTVLNGDDYGGERCELGRNARENGENTGTQTSGTFALYKEGERKITFWSMRFPANFDTVAHGWQVIMQMKQAQSYAANGPVNSAPAIDLQAGWDSFIRLYGSWALKWTTSAPANGVWFRVALDATYSADPTKGRIQVFLDRDGDGDADAISPVITMRTLAYASSAGSGLNVGDPIPGHLRLGVYHDSAVYGTTTVHVDNVQVVG